MSKKIFALLLVLVLLVGCFAACKKDEEDTPTPDTETPGENPGEEPGDDPAGPGENPGEKPGDEHTHNFVEGKCECGETDPNYVAPHVHTWDEGTEYEATCTEPGGVVYFCTDETCEEYNVVEDEENKPATGHSYATEPDPNYTTPTCEESGLLVYWCTAEGCNAYDMQEGEPALGHALDDGTSVDPTCLRDGYTLFVCTREGCAHTETTPGEKATGHSFADGKCSACGVYNEDYHGHFYVDGKCACGATDPNYNPLVDDGKSYTYNTYVSLSPSNWNELTYQDNNDTEVMSWIGSSFFTYDFKYDDNGEILPGEFQMKYGAATNLEDISAVVDPKWNVPEGATGYAYRITLREDLRWENGDRITAHDFVYTMKQQLDPLFQNYRADSFYNGSTILINAESYVKQGQKGIFSARSVYTTFDGADPTNLIWNIGPAIEGALARTSFRAWFEDSHGAPSNYPLDKTVAFLNANYGFPAYDDTFAAMEGKTLAEIYADEAMAAKFDEVISWWKTLPDEELDFFLSNYEYPKMDFSEVGIYAESDIHLVIVLAKALPLIKEDGSLSYKAAYNMSSLPLVHKATYEANKHEPTEGSELWTSTYNSSVESTMSWGPYKLQSFQSGKEFTLVRNDMWYGYSDYQEGTYQTDKVVYSVIKEWNAAWIAFQEGSIDGIGIDVSIADDYKNSSRAFFTPSDFVSSLQLQSSMEALKSREESGINKSILGYTEFRKALSLAINRAEFTRQCTTSSLAGFGLYNSMHYNDVENGGVYRNTDEAKKVLCSIYGVDPLDYGSLDEAVDAITGYDLEQARALVTSAYNAALAAGDIGANDKVLLTFGTGAINEAVQRQYDFIAKAWVELVKNTPLEGRLELELVDRGQTWSNDFRGGGYDVCMGGWTGAAWDPGYFLLAYLSPDYMYSAAWETDKVTMTFTMEGVGPDGEDITDTMSLLDWYDCLNGNSGAKYDFSSNALAESDRVQLIAALEAQVLGVYYTVPLANSFSASLISYKCDYITYEYNTFLSYGGVKYMTYNYDDAEWEAVLDANDYQLDYKK